MPFEPRTEDLSLRLLSPEVGRHLVVVHLRLVSGDGVPGVGDHPGGRLDQVCGVNTVDLDFVLEFAVFAEFVNLLCGLASL